MNKKLLALMLSAAMAAAAVTGCSSSKKETEAQTKATEAQTEAKTEAAAAPETEAAAAVEEAVSEAAGTVEEAATEAAASATAVEEAISEAAEEAMTEAEAVAEEAMTEAAAAVEETMSEAEAVVEEASTEAEAVEEAATEAAEAAEAVEEAATEAEEVVEEAMTEAEAVVEETMSEAEAVAEEAMTEAAAAVEETMSEAEAVAEEVMTEAEAVVEEAATEAAEVEEAVEEAATEAEEAVEEAMTEAAAVVEETMSEAEEVAEEVMTEAEAVVEEAATEAAEAVEEAMTEAEAAAEEVQEAVEEAESEMEASVGEAAAAVAAAAAAMDETEEAAEAEMETEEAVETALEEVQEEVTEAMTEEETEAEVVYEVSLEDEGITGTYEDMQVGENDIVVLYTNDIHGGISADADYSGSDMSLGFAGLAAVKAEAMEDALAVTTVDNGDAIQGSVVTTESDGQDVMNLMEEVQYDIRVPGNHEFDYGMEAFLDYANNANSAFICSNFMDTTTGEAVFDGYTLIDYEVNGDVLTIGYVGMCTPETIAKSTPTYFQDEEGNYIYSFDAETPQALYDNIQASIDAAYEEGADFVIGLSHMGDTGVEADWSSIAVAANTTGMDIILDGHAHSEIAGTIITNKDGEDVLLTSTGTKLENFGLLKLTVAEDGTVTAQSGLVDTLSEEELASDEYARLDESVQAIEEGYAYLFVVEGTTDYDLVIYDPETEERLIRVAETNMGDFLTDAYRIVYDNEIGMLNGGSIRANIEAGEINFMELLTVFPWNTEYSVVEVSGQVILDALEMGAHLYPEECGGFMQVSGMSYKIDTTIPSSVNVNTDGEFVSVDGEYRVKDVMVGDEPLDLERIYRLGINTYYSKEYGDGMTMFKDCKFVFPADAAVEDVEEESTEAEAAAEEIPTEPVIDHDVIIAYLDSFGGVVPEEYADPYGQGRITLITEETKLAEEAAQMMEEQESEELEIAEAVAAVAVEAGAVVEEQISEAEAVIEEKAAEAEATADEMMSEAESLIEEEAAEVGALADEAMSEAEALIGEIAEAMTETE